MGSRGRGCGKKARQEGETVAGLETVEKVGAGEGMGLGDEEMAGVRGRERDRGRG